jgi:S1-C subfamily serine protease
MDLVDIAILGMVLIGVANGYRRGFWLSATQYVGLVAGVVGGGAAAPAVTSLISGPLAAAKPIAAVVTLLVGGALGSALGYWAGERIRSGITGRRERGPLDGLGGGAFSAVAVLTIVWFLGITFSQGPSPDLAREIQGSYTLRKLDAVAPKTPGFLVGTQRVLAGVPFPQTFAGLEPMLPERVGSLPAEVNTAGVQAAAAATVKIEGRGCSGIVDGSGYPVGGDFVVTDAHVVAGTRDTKVLITGRQALSATTVLFDADRDIAVLHVPGLRLEALPQGEGSRGTQGAVIGYPLGQSIRVEPAVVDGAVVATGRDIYNENLVNRQIWIVEASVKPGNSGGPLVDLQGRVLGMVFAASSTQPDQAYALTNAEVARDVEKAKANPLPTDTTRFRCAV